jgi:hypothetical protein
MNRNIFTFVVVCLAFTLAACSASTQEIPAPSTTQGRLESTDTSAPSETITVPQAEESPYPSPTAREVPIASPQSYPQPNSSSQTPQVDYIVPEPSDDKGVVLGQLINSYTDMPLPFQSVYLGKKIPLTPGPGYSYTLQERSSPHTVTNEDGKFALGDVAPGTYIIMIFHPFATSVIMEPNSDRELEIVVSAGKVLDLGEIKGLPPVE